MPPGESVKIHDNLFALIVHSGILLIICVLVLATSCQQPPPVPVPDPVGDFFDKISDSLDEAGSETIIVIAVDDNIGAGQDIKRQVYQEIQSRLHQLESANIIEYPSPVLDEKFREKDIVPSEGISPDEVKSLATELASDTLLYASIESSAPDVYIKIYSGETGAVIFAETLQKWPLPVEKAPEEMPSVPGALGEASSDGTTGAEGVGTN
jgi:hypothetical protein